MDKHSLKKHHFWILLGLAVVLVPVACSGAMFGVGGQAQERIKKIDDELSSLQKQQVKPDDYRDQLEKQKAELQSQKIRVWAAAYKAQEGLVHWPRALSHLDPLYFGDAITDQDRANFMRPEVYLAEYNKLPEVIAPTEFPDRNWQSVLRWVPEFKTLPTPEEVWLALEDLSVQQEVLRDVHAVNQMLAEFLPVPVAPKAPAKPQGTAVEEKKRYDEEWGRYLKAKEAYDAAKRKVDEELKATFKPTAAERAFRFISPYWQLDVVVGRKPGGRAGELDFRGRLTNTSPRRQNVAEIGFRLWLTNPDRPNAEYVVLPIQAEYLAAGDHVDFAETRIGQADPNLTVYKVEQKLDSRYVPVKRVDRLVLDYPSNRFSGKALVAAAVSEEEKKKAAAAAPPPPPTGTATSDTRFGGGANPQDSTPNGIPRNRYLERTDQVRRLPIALVLIVDEAHVQDVLRALANSRLRFQNTQVHYQRFRGIINLEEPTPIASDQAPADSAQGRPNAPPGRSDGRKFGGTGGTGGAGVNMVADPAAGGPNAGERERGGSPRQRPGFVPGSPFGTPSSGSSGSTDNENNNLVELTVYGLISLYERFPPKPSADPNAANPANPAAPPPAGGTTPPPPPNAPFAPPTPPAGGGIPPPPAPGSDPTATPPPKPPGSS
jgi:hypothetical protein